MFPRAVICVSGENPQEITHLIQKAEHETEASIIEIRADYLQEKFLHLDTLMLFRQKSKRQLILTIRIQKEGGHTKIDNQLRKKLFLDAIALGYDYIDIEESSDKELINELINNRGNASIILSYHNFNEMNELKIESKIESMKKFNPDIMKIVMTAQNYTDNLIIEKILRKYGNSVPLLTCFCLGEIGKESRIKGHTLGNVLTYISLNENTSTAAGQLTYSEFLMI